jgi:hypothetical protein
VNETDELKESELLLICKARQGAYLPGGSPRTSWATTYGDEFVAAASELYLLYARSGRVPVNEMSRAFRREGIRTCRGAEMTVSRVSYLISMHICRDAR